MKKEVLVVFSLFLLLSIGFISAGWFDWLKPTGKVIDESNFFEVNLSVGESYTLNDGRIVQVESIRWGSLVLNVSGELSSSMSSGRFYIVSNNVSIYVKKVTQNSFSDDSVTSGNSVTLLIGKEYQNSPSTKPSLPEENVTCIDSDGGINLYKYGEVNLGLLSDGTLGVEQDYCFDTNFIMERWCGDSGLEFEKYECPNGCLNGACYNKTGYFLVTFPFGGKYLLNNSKSLEIGGIYSDSIEVIVDGTSKIISKGSIAKVNGLRIIVEDINYNSNVPESSSVVLGLEDIYQDNYALFSGCIDTDGINFYLKGTTTGLGDDGQVLSINDSCSPELDSVKDYYCDNYHVVDETFYCPNGCSDGACIKLNLSYSGVCSGALNLMQRVSNDGNMSIFGVNEYSYSGESYESSKKSFAGTLYSYSGERWVNSNRESFTEYYTYFGVNSYHTYTEEWENDWDRYYITLTVFEDKNISLEEFFKDKIDWNVCVVEELDDGVNSNQIYICKDLWELTEDSDDNSDSYRIFSYNNNVILEISVYNGDVNSEDEENRQTQNILSFLEELKNNEYEDANLYIDWFSRNEVLQRFLAECPSDVDEDLDMQPSWKCNLEPAVCPSHGYQVKKCVDANGFEEDKEETISCNPGICSGCMMPKWSSAEGWEKLDTKCMPYESRWQIENGYSSEQREIDEEDLEIISIQDVLDDDEVNLEIYSNEIAWFAINNEGAYFNSSVEKGKFYDIKESYSSDSYISNLNYSFYVEDISYNSNNYNQSNISLIVIVKGFVQDEIPQYLNVYCDYTGEIMQQKTREYTGDWAKCQNNFECESNFCSSGECIEIQNMLDSAGQFKALGIRIFCKFAYLFNEDSYNSCVYKFVE